MGTLDKIQIQGARKKEGRKWIPKVADVKEMEKKCPIFCNNSEWVNEKLEAKATKKGAGFGWVCPGCQVSGMLCMYSSFMFCFSF